MNGEKIKAYFQLIRDQKPLIHHITNKVTINDCANITLAIGASPVMADFYEEVEEMVGQAKALVLNFGMLNNDTFEAMILAGRKANERNIPVIFDPVGVGATSYRKLKANQLLKEIRISTIRGNQSEIASIVGLPVRTKGVDAEEVNMVTHQIAGEASRLYNSIIVVSGRTDVVTDGKRTCFIKNGHEWMTKMTGTGCASNSLIAAFSGVTTDYYHAAVAGMSVMGICGERAIKEQPSPPGLGTLKVNLLDEISRIDAQTWKDELKLEEMGECN